ncbi:hypothetical protein ADUPG1_011767, partial [Aduncisulcus paluster]
LASFSTYSSWRKNAGKGFHFSLAASPSFPMLLSIPPALRPSFLCHYPHSSLSIPMLCLTADLMHSISFSPSLSALTIGADMGDITYDLDHDAPNGMYPTTMNFAFDHFPEAPSLTSLTVILPRSETRLEKGTHSRVKDRPAISTKKTIKAITRAYGHTLRHLTINNCNDLFDLFEEEDGESSVDPSSPDIEHIRDLIVKFPPRLKNLVLTEVPQHTDFSLLPLSLPPTLRSLKLVAEKLPSGSISSSSERKKNKSNSSARSFKEEEEDDLSTSDLHEEEESELDSTREYREPSPHSQIPTITVGSRPLFSIKNRNSISSIPMEKSVDSDTPCFDSSPSSETPSSSAWKSKARSMLWSSEDKRSMMVVAVAAAAVYVLRDLITLSISHFPFVDMVILAQLFPGIKNLHLSHTTVERRLCKNPKECNLHNWKRLGSSVSPKSTQDVAQPSSSPSSCSSTSIPFPPCSSSLQQGVRTQEEMCVMLQILAKAIIPGVVTDPVLKLQRCMNEDKDIQDVNSFTPPLLSLFPNLSSYHCDRVCGCVFDGIVSKAGMTFECSDVVGLRSSDMELIEKKISEWRSKMIRMSGSDDASSDSDTIREFIAQASSTILSKSLSHYIIFPPVSDQVSIEAFYSE